MKIDLDEYIEEAFKSRWVGESVLSSLENMKAQLYKNLKNQIDGYWSGHTAYHLMIDYGFLIDAKHENGKRKNLTRLGVLFIEDYLATKTDSEAG